MSCEREFVVSDSTRHHIWTCLCALFPTLDLARYFENLYSGEIIAEFLLKFNTKTWSFLEGEPLERFATS